MNKRGFTLIELLIVVFIIGVLASIVTASVNSARVKARDTKRKTDIVALKKAIEMYANANQLYISTYNATLNLDEAVSMNNALVQPLTAYLSPLPHDPAGAARLNQVNTTGPTDYLYVGSGDGKSYGLLVTMDSWSTSNDNATTRCLTGNNFTGHSWWSGAYDNRPCSF